MPKVNIINEKKEIDVDQGGNLRTEARKKGVEPHAGIEKYINCVGNGLCGTCRVLVKKGGENLSEKTFIEKLTLMRMFATIGNENEMRLACQCKVNGDCDVVTCPPMNWSGETFWQKPYPNK